MQNKSKKDYCLIRYTGENSYKFACMLGFHNKNAYEASLKLGKCIYCGKDLNHELLSES